MGSGRVWEGPKMNLKGFHLQRWEMPDEGGGKEPGERESER